MTTPGRATWPAIIAALAVCLFLSHAPAQTIPTTMPSLGVLDRATQELYRSAESHLVRVHVPVRIASDHPLDKWQGHLDQPLRELLDSAMARGQAPGLFVEPSALPAQVGAPLNRVPIPGPSSIVHVECVGLVLSPRGDVLLPLHIDPAAIQELSVALDEQKMTTARVRASDRMTGLTIVRPAENPRTPVRFAKAAPAAGSIVLMIAPTRRAARLAVWTGEGRNENGIIVDSAGDCAGIVRNGHELYPARFMPIVEQLLSQGAVRRAELGARLSEVSLDDPHRARQPKPGARTAVLVEDVISGSAAATGGLHAGDLVLSLAGESVTDIPTFAAAMANRLGRTEMLVLRDGRERSVIVDLQPR